MIRHRIVNGAIMIALLVGALFLPAFGLFLIIPLLSALMLWECYYLLHAAGLPSFRVLGIVGGLALIFATGLNYHLFQGAGVYEWEGVILAGLVFLVLTRQCFENNDAAPLLPAAATLMGILYTAFLFNFYTKLLLGWPDGDGRYVLFYMILVVKVTDMAAYATGCSIGRHKLIPRLSPAKTWEGCAGGVLGGLITSLLFWRLADGQVGPMTLGIADAVILGIVLPVAGIVGDLIESMLKRAANVKDSGTWLKGMGGVLDVLDSLLFAAPILYIYILVVLTP